MPKSPNQKLKLLYIAKLLKERSDEQHPISTNDIISYLETKDISAERKSIYDDLQLLTTFGLDIEKSRSKTTGYYLASRDFELPELKLLVDSVQSSKFITEKKTLSLIKKIEGLASIYDGQKLQRQVYVSNRVKSMNESVYYNVDIISDAISADKMIEFKYFNYTVSKERAFRRNGATYIISPFSLMWDNENYYLIGYDSQYQEIRHFRVDKMTNVTESPEARIGKELLSSLDMTSYTKSVFGMFQGSTEKVHMKFSSFLVGAVIDRFGKNIFISSYDSEHFAVNVDVSVSPQFYAWILGFGSDAEILGPANVRDGLMEHIKNVAKLYDI